MEDFLGNKNGQTKKGEWCSGPLMTGRYGSRDNSGKGGISQDEVKMISSK
jgi:hypothetical protein